MRVKKIEINNYKSIGNMVLNLSKCNIIVGKNHIGKTNTISAPYWLFTGKQFDGSSDDIGIKPIGNEGEKISVKVIFEDNDGKEQSIEKTYQEKWTKTRGSEELTLTGHETKYLINGLEQKKISEALTDIDAMLGMEDSKMNNVKNIDKYQLLTNPLYVEMCDWKALRNLIISIVGDVSNEDVFTMCPNVISSKLILERFGYDTGKATLFCNQQIDAAKSKVGELVAKKDYLKSVKDLPKEECERLQKELAEVNDNIEKLENGTLTENPEITRLNKEIDVIEKKLVDMNSKERTAYSESIKEIVSNNQKLVSMVNDKEVALRLAKEELNRHTGHKESTERDIELLNMKIQLKEGNKAKKLEEYRSIKSEEYIGIASVTCPHCNGVLNQDELDNHKERWEKNHQEKINKNIEEGKKLKLEIDELNSQKKENNVILAEINKSIDAANTKVNEAQESLNVAIQHKKDNYREVEAFIPSVEYEELASKKLSLVSKVRELNRADAPQDNSIEIANEKVRKANIEEEIGKHYSYINAQKELEGVEGSMKSFQKEQLEYECRKEEITLFNKTKLDLLDSRLKQHFGEEVKFVLVKNNIKEGSWENVCYPTIIGTNTPFKNGSRSEKVMTGVKIIEVIRRELQLPNLPIFIDEIGELDSESLAKLISGTDSQIIASKVDDNYNVPTLKIVA